MDANVELEKEMLSIQNEIGNERLSGLEKMIREDERGKLMAKLTSGETLMKVGIWHKMKNIDLMAKAFPTARAKKYAESMNEREGMAARTA